MNDLARRDDAVGLACTVCRRLDSAPEPSLVFRPHNVPYLHVVSSAGLVRIASLESAVARQAAGRLDVLVCDACVDASRFSLPAVAGQGQVLLAHWPSPYGRLFWSAWDSFGTGPFAVHAHGQRVHFALCGMLLRVSDRDVTLVLRSNAVSQFQATLLHSPWGNEWYSTASEAVRVLGKLTHALAMLASPKLGDGYIFSGLHNYVILDIPYSLKRAMDTVFFTSEGERLKGTRAAAPTSQHAHLSGEESIDEDEDEDGSGSTVQKAKRERAQQDVAEDPVVLHDAVGPCCCCSAVARDRFQLSSTVDGNVQVARSGRIFGVVNDSHLERALCAHIDRATFVQLCDSCQVWLVDAAPDLAPRAGQGEVLLAHWRTRASQRLSVWDSYGSAPFKVARQNGRDLYATCGVLMRFSVTGSTLVIRTNAAQQFQVCLLGEAWPEQWLSWTRALKLVNSYPQPKIGRVFSVTQNQVTLGAAVFKMIILVTFTPEGRRMLAQRASVPGVSAENLRIQEEGREEAAAEAEEDDDDVVVVEEEEAAEAEEDVVVVEEVVEEQQQKKKQRRLVSNGFACQSCGTTVAGGHAFVEHQLLHVRALLEQHRNKWHQHVAQLDVQRAFIDGGK